MSAVLDVIEIPQSTRKLWWTAVGAVAFVALGAVMLSLSSQPLFVRVCGGASVAFFGLIAVYSIRRLRRPRIGLTLTPDGLVDQSSAVSAGLVPWREVTRLGEWSMSGTRCLILHVRDPAPYLARGNLLQRMAKRANHRMVGSPIAVASTTLAIGFDELARLVQTYLEHALRAGEAPSSDADQQGYSP